MPIADRIKQLRTEAGLSQSELAERVGIHVSELRRYEADSSSPTLDVLRKLAIALSVSADTLVFDAERDSDEELRLQLEATQRLTDEDRELEALDVSLDYLAIENIPRRPLHVDDRGLAERLAELSELDDDRDAFLRVLDAFLTRKRLRVLARDAH
jgi:transcriptional regulator with XRE-family HTH domain